jgi:[calcium/calmodulin-dependent protein kinase] kinase
VISEEAKDLMLKAMAKDPELRPTLPQIKEHEWVTKEGRYHIMPEEENCTLVTVNDEEVDNSITSVPKLDTLVSHGHGSTQGRTYCSWNAWFVKC